MTPSELARPDLEDLAAYVDGRLKGKLRRQVEERLARDEDYYEVFLETVRFQEEEAARSAPLVVRRWTTPWLPVLAAAALVVVAVGIWRLTNPVSAGPLAALDRLDARAVVGQDNWDTPGWSVVRSETLPRWLTEEHLAFRLGASTVNLLLALAADDRGQAVVASSRATDLTGELNLFQKPRFEGLAQTLADPSAVPAKLTGEAKDLVASLDESLGESSLEARYLALGQWTQAARLAALVGDRELLADLVQHAPPADDLPEVAAALGTVTSDDPDQAVTRLEAVARLLGG